MHRKKVGLASMAVAAGVLMASTQTQAVPFVEEFLTDGGIEFVIHNPAPTPGAIMSMVAFVDPGLYADTFSNGFGYQTIMTVDDWQNQNIFGQGIAITPNSAGPQPVSWFDLYGGSDGLGDLGASLIDSGLVGLGYFSAFQKPDITGNDGFSTVADGPGDPMFTLDGMTYGFFNPAELIQPNDVVGGFFGLNAEEFQTQFLVASVGPNSTGQNPGNLIITTFNNDPARGVPEPITATLGLMGLGVLGMATRRRTA